MTITIGIDVHKATLAVAVAPTGEHWTSPTTPAAVDRLVARLGTLEPTLIVLEATGGYQRPVVAALAAAQLPVRVANPRQVRAYAHATGQVAKTDRLDARLLARYGAQVQPELRPLPDAAALAVRDLEIRRRQVVAQRTAELHRLGQSTAVTRPSIERMVAVLDEEVRVLTDALAAQIAAHPVWAAQARTLQTVPGIGHRTAVALLSLLPELGTVDGKQIAALVGVAPLDQESGQRRGPARIQGGRRAVRTALWSPTMTAMRWNPVLGALATRLKARGKHHHVVVIACMRKLLTLLNAMLRDGTEWAPSGVQPVAGP